MPMFRLIVSSVYAKRCCGKRDEKHSVRLGLQAGQKPSSSWDGQNLGMPGIGL